MAKDADGNYYYDAGTLAEYMDNWEVYEDSDGNVGFYDGSDEFRLQNLAFVIGNTRTSDPTTSDLAQGEGMMYFFDDGANGVFLRAAYHDAQGTIQTADVSTDLESTA